MQQLVLVLQKGDHLVGSLVSFCGKKNISSAWISGIGALSKATLALYNLENKSYSKKEIPGPLEIASLSGNVGLLNNKLVSHLHIVVSGLELQAFGGHLDEAIVSATCEIYIQILPVQIKRSHHTEIGLNLITS